MVSAEMPLTRRSGSYAASVVQDKTPSEGVAPVANDIFVFVTFIFGARFTLPN